MDIVRHLWVFKNCTVADIIFKKSALSRIFPSNSAPSHNVSNFAKRCTATVSHIGEESGAQRSRAKGLRRSWAKGLRRGALLTPTPPPPPSPKRKLTCRPRWVPRMGGDGRCLLVPLALLECNWAWLYAWPALSAILRCQYLNETSVVGERGAHGAAWCGYSKTTRKAYAEVSR